MKTSRKLLITVSAILGTPLVVIVGFYLSASIYYSGHDDLGSFSLPNGHRIHLFNDRQWDVDYSLLCEIDGPTIRQEPRCIAAILSSDSPPHFTIHSPTNSQVFWVTADTKPTAILYIVDFESRSCWPGSEDGEDESAKGRRLLALVNSKEAGYRLYDSDDIGIKK
jgi:hypothetical protein